MVTRSLKLNTKKRKRKTRQCALILHNDKTSSFEHVIKTLTTNIPMCNTLRAAQLAQIVHDKGSCIIYRGRQTDVFVVYSMMNKHGLTLSVEMLK